MARIETLLLDSYTPLSSSARTFTNLQAHAPIMNRKVLKVMVLSNVVGDYVGSPGGSSAIAASTSVVDRVAGRVDGRRVWPGTGDSTTSSREWPFDVAAGQDVGDGIYDLTTASSVRRTRRSSSSTGARTRSSARTASRLTTTTCGRSSTLRTSSGAFLKE